MLTTKSKDDTKKDNAVDEMDAEPVDGSDDEIEASPQTTNELIQEATDLVNAIKRDTHINLLEKGGADATLFELQRYLTKYESGTPKTWLGAKKTINLDKLETLMKKHITTLSKLHSKAIKREAETTDTPPATPLQEKSFALHMQELTSTAIKELKDQPSSNNLLTFHAKAWSITKMTAHFAHGASMPYNNAFTGIAEDPADLRLAFSHDQRAGITLGAVSGNQIAELRQVLTGWKGL